MANLPVFEGLELNGIVEVATAAGAERAEREIMQADVVGFDTESKPVFVRGHVSTGPHVAQFSTLERAYVFMLHDETCRHRVGVLLASEKLKKVGFGLREDLRRIPIKLGVEPKSVLDLETLFAARGHGRGVGARVAVAIALKRRLLKSRKASTSNWMRHRLSDKQLLYAANDAYAAIKVYEAMMKRRG
jgi:ribonuclease D